MPGKMLRKNEYREKWYEWKQAGHEPTHAEAIARIAEEITDARGFGKTFARETKSGVLGTRLSFVYWDIAHNQRRALHYDGQVSLLKDLLSQAGEIVYGAYARAVMKMRNGRTGTLPRMHKTKTRGHVRTEDTSAKEREEWVENLIDMGKMQIERAKTLSLDWPFVRRALARLCREMRSEYRADRRRAA